MISENSFYCLVNPLAGGRKGIELIKTLNCLKEQGLFRGEVSELDFEHIKQQIIAAQSFDRLLVAGGDGTISFVLAALRGEQIPVGILALGTGNDLAKELGVYNYFCPKNLELILNFYQKAISKALTVWKLEYGENLEKSETFVNYLSFGFDASVVSRFSRWRKSNYYFLDKFGKYGNRLAYFLASFLSLKDILNLKESVFRNDSQQIIKIPNSLLRSRTLLFPNIKSIMGLGISNIKSNPFDDKMELVISKSLFSYLAIITRLKFPCSHPKLIETSKSWDFGGLNGTAHIQIDGEAREDITSTKYRIQPSHKINILTSE